MSRSGIEQMLYMMDRSFDPDASAFGTWHSFLVNLESVNDDDWLWVPERGVRSMFEIVQHVGECKYAYDSCAFGDGSIHWDYGNIPSIDPESPRAEVVRWLEEGQSLLRGHLAALDDDSELTVLRGDTWGGKKETRWLLGTMIQHDLYHAGELNHLRALRHGNDNWGNEP